FLLLNHADDESLQRSTYKVEDTSDPGLYSNIEITQVIDKSSYLDNYYSHILSSVAAVFFWTNGRWDQLDQWDNYS
ncbi:20384_t:CDS:1, partial [Dentiscutata erythropus]